MANPKVVYKNRSVSSVSYQLRGIKGAVTFTDSTKDDRKELGKAIKFMRRGDMFCVESFYHIANSVTDMREIVKKLVNSGIEVFFKDEDIVFTDQQPRNLKRSYKLLDGLIALENKLKASMKFETQAVSFACAEHSEVEDLIPGDGRIDRSEIEFRKGTLPAPGKKSLPRSSEASVTRDMCQSASLNEFIVPSKAKKSLSRTELNSASALLAAGFKFSEVSKSYGVSDSLLETCLDSL